MKKTVTFFMMAAFMIAVSPALSGNNKKAKKSILNNKEFNYVVEQFADVQVLRYRVADFDQLTLQQKELIYYLSQAALEGRDILFDQNGKYNLVIRRTLEAVYLNYNGDKSSDDYKNFILYLKRVWFSNGIHHHYAADKFLPEFSETFFTQAVKSIDASNLPLNKGQTVDELLSVITPVMFDPNIDAKRINQADGEDLILTSAANYYEGVTQSEAENFYDKMKDPNDLTPISYGLNSRLVKANGEIFEKIWKSGGLYGAAIDRIIGWLQKAEKVAENDMQKNVIAELIKYYQTGDLKTFDTYSILWVEDDSQVDFINGFIETYGDPLGLKASWESLVNFKNIEATKRTEIISNNAQWFEDLSPVDTRFKKETVKGVSAKVITAAILGGDCYPATPIGINLPNSNWIRAQHGSKSVTIENITEAYDKAAQGNGFAQEFYWSDKEIDLIKQYGFMVDNLHTDMHECLGHGSGKLLPGVDPDALKAYGAVIEETRADLYGLYYVADKKMVELGLLPNEEAYKAAYYKFMTNGLMTQLSRIKPGKQIEQAHMRNRQLIANRILEKGAAANVVEFKQRDGKTFVAVNDYAKLRELFGKLLGEVQRIKSEGDYESAKVLVENYAVKVNPKLHTEVLERYAKLNIAPYRGFVNPVYEVVTDKKGKITDIKLHYTEGYTEQMLRYSKEYSWLPTWN